VLFYLGGQISERYAPQAAFRVSVLIILQ